jgi:hypothetical protein
MLWGLLFLVVGCAAPAQVPGPEPGQGDGVILVANWTSARTLVDNFIQPDFVLYGDGRAVVREEHDSGVLKIVEYHLTPQRVRALFGEAAAAGLFDDVDYSRDLQVLDASIQVVMLRTTEGKHVVKTLVPGPDDHGPRGKVGAFLRSLHLSRWPADDFSTPPAPYRPGRVAVTYMPAEQTAHPNGVPRTWPLAEPVLSECVVLTGDAATRAQELAETQPLTTLWQHGDLVFQALSRPLLLDEADCQATRQSFRERM